MVVGVVCVGGGGGEGVYWLCVRKFRRVRDNVAVRLFITPPPPHTHTHTDAHPTIFFPSSSCVQ